MAVRHYITNQRNAGPTFNQAVAAGSSRLNGPFLRMLAGSPGRLSALAYWGVGGVTAVKTGYLLGSASVNEAPGLREIAPSGRVYLHLP